MKKELLTNLRVGFPVSGTLSILPDKVGTGIDDRELIVMQGTTAGGNEVRLYFDSPIGSSGADGAFERSRRLDLLPLRWTMPTIATLRDSRYRFV